MDTTKKQYVLLFLDKIIPYRGEVQKVKDKLMSKEVTTEYIDRLYDICSNIIKKTKSENNKHTMELMAKKMKVLYEQEKLSQAEDLKDLEVLETMLEKL